VRLGNSNDTNLLDAALGKRLSALREKLVSARGLYDADRTNPVDQGRTGVRLALGAVIECFDGLGFGSNALEPLRAAFHALTDVDEGRRNALLEPANAPGRAPASVITVALQAAAAAALEMGMKAGHSKPEAAKAVAKALTQGGFSIPGKSHVTSRAVILWRDKFSGFNGGIPGAAQYAHFVEAMQQAPSAPEKRFEDALKLLTELPQHLRFGVTPKHT
jgi:hypothetical protein